MKPTVKRVVTDWGIHHETMLADVAVSEGGWYEGSWLKPKDIEAAQKRWWQRGNSTLVENHQCGGCKFFAAAGSDWGLCWNEDSRHDGRMMFEHNGCNRHSDLK